MNTEKLESDIKALVMNINEETFIYDLLRAYGLPKASITRLQKGDYNLSKVQDEILWKEKLFFKNETDIDIHQSIDQIRLDSAITKQHPRFLVVTDFKTLLSVDTKTGDTLDISVTGLAKYYDFFLPWAGLESVQFQSENPADVKAAERMGRLYDLILEDNPTEKKDEIHALNIFLSRLLFCFFAEDTGIFQDNQFTNAIASHTADDGSDLHNYLQKLFAVLNLRERSEYPQFLQDFPYVNGGLFADEYPIPKFSNKSRKIIVECGALNWKAINPDIFGSMIQAVVHNDQRSNMGMHYTSVVNIMKVIDPLFLNDLKEALEKSECNEKKLTKLLGRLYNLRIFDPACGSGNFLIIAYKELCLLEIEIFKQLQQINTAKWKNNVSGEHFNDAYIAISGLHLNQFYGIELDDFAHETAKLSLWLTEHQMNLAFKEVFGEVRATLPLQDSGNITCGNATRLDWEVVCPMLDTKGSAFEIYILGNPPYIGSKNQKKSQKNDLKLIADRLKGYGILDYVSCWFIKAANYFFDSHCNVRCAFVSTSSITQGEQVAVMWPYILQHGLDIYFSVSAFNWSNNARQNASVYCVIIGLGINIKNKYIYTDNACKSVKNISPYLIANSSCIVEKRTKSLANFPIMGIGNKPIDDGNYLFSNEEKEEFIKQEPNAKNYFFRWYGGREFSGGIIRWCLLPQRIPDIEIERMPKVKDLVNKVQQFRLNSSSTPTIKLAQTPKNFHVENFPISDYMVVQKVSTGIRKYLPVGIFKKDLISSDLLNVIKSSDLSIFAIISSKMHMVWMSAVGGRLGDGFRYSSYLCYNTFPFPEITEAQKAPLKDHVFKVLDEREQHSEKTMAQLYDPDKMPEYLRLAHHEMDLAVEQCYRSKPFSSDEERLEYLFTLYEEMIAAEKKT